MINSSKMIARNTINTLIFLCLTLISIAQWTQYPSIPTGNVESVQAWDQNVIYASQPEQILRSTDGGANWATLPVANASGNLFIGTNFYDFHLLSPGVIVAVGIASLGNQEIIYRSDNYGVSWTVVSLYVNGTWPRIPNAVHFPTSTTGYVVGTNGRVLKSTNSGTSWSSISSGTTTELKDVFFTSSTNGYAVGNGRIIRTTNGGSSWTATVASGTILNAVHFPSSTVGYAVGDDRKILKTTNAGSLWTQSTMNIPFNTNLTSVYFVSETEGYVTASNGVIYHTTSGGEYWEHQVMNGYLNDVSFIDPATGFLAGDDTQFLHTSGTVTYTPIANFSASSNTVCNDSTLTFTNTSDPSLSFEWLFNGVSFSTNYNATYNFANPSQNDTISLVVFNGVYYDTLDRIISVQDDLEFIVNGGIQSLEVCSGQSRNMYVYNSIPGIIYSLTKNGTQVGSTQTGNGNTLTFSTGAITTTSTVCVRGVKTVPGCGSNTEFWCTNVTLQNPNPATIIELIQDTVCVGTSTSITLYSSQIGVSYQLYQGTNLVGLAQNGNGGTLNFFTLPISASMSYYIRGTSSLGCITNFPSMTIHVQNPGIYWSASSFNPEVGEQVDLINNSTFPQGTFTWYFGANASPITSSLSDPQDVVFNTAGQQNVSLTYVTPLGCSQTVNKTINVIPTFTEANCDGIFLNSFSPSTAILYATNRDKDMNIYSVFKHTLNAQNYTESNHGDSLNLGLTPIANFDKSYTVIKYSPKGVPMWSTQLRSGTNGDGGEVITDTTGNVYVAYYHDDFGDSLRIYSADGRFVSIMPPHSGSTMQSVIIVKYDSNGIYLWHTTFLDVYTVWKVSLKLDEDQNLFASGANRVVKYNPSGLLQWQFTGNIADIEPDYQGGVFVLQGNGMVIDHYSENGVLMESSTALPTLSNSVAGARHLAQDENGDLYAFGNFRGSMIFGADTITDIYTGGQVHEDVYLAKFSSNLEKLWIKQFKGNSAMPVQGIDILDNTIMISFLNYGSTMEYLQGDTLFNNADVSYFLFKCDTLGTTDEITMFYNSTATSISSNIPCDNLVLSNGGNNFDFGFEFKDNFTASTGTSFTMNPATGFRYFGINLAETACVFNETSPTDVPIAYFSAPLNVCAGTTVDFTDGSLNNPTQWNWTFQDGSIVLSTDQNPSVTFTAVGVHPITLTVINTFGQSQVYSSYVNVVAAPVATINGDDYVCSGSTGSVNVTTTSQYYWSNGSTSMYVTLYPLTADSTLTVTVYNEGCSIELSHTFQVESVPVITMTGTLPDTVCTGDSPFSLPLPNPLGGNFFSNLGGVTGTTFYPANATPGTDNYVFYDYYTPNANCYSQWQGQIYVENGDLWATIQSDIEGCEGNELSFSSTVSDETITFQWDFDGGTGTNVNAQTTSAVFNQPGNYTVGLTVSNNICLGTTVYQNLYIEATPIVLINTFSPDLICSNAGLLKVPSATPAGGLYYDQQGAMPDETTIDAALMTVGQTNYVYYYYETSLGCFNIDSTAITTETCSNLSENGQSPFTIAQGETENHFILGNLETGTDVVLINALGQTLRNYSINEEELMINLTNEANGIYLLSISNKNKRAVFRVFNP